MEKYEELQNFINSMMPDFQKFYEKGQAAAGTRLRKSLSELTKMAKQLREDIQNLKEDRKSE